MDKIRITLYNKDGTIESDRLTSFQGEMYAGPKENHEGAIRMDVQFNTGDQVTTLMEYLKKLTGALPIDEKKKSSPATTTEMNSGTVNALLNDVLAKSNQEEVIDHLRFMNFQFICYEHLVDVFEKNSWELDIKKESHKTYQYMVRVLRLAVDPKNDKIDPSLVFAIKVVGDRVPGFHIYNSGKFQSSVKMDWPEKSINFKVKEKFYEFPDAMLIDERAKWRAEDRKVQTNPDYEPTPFYNRWKTFVTILQPLKIKKK